MSSNDKLAATFHPAEGPQHLCVNGNRCISKVDGHARETPARDTFCDACLNRTAERIEQLPEQYVRLHQMLGDRHAGVDVNIRRPKPGSTVLLNIHIDTLLGNIVETVTTAAEALADKMRMDNPDKPTPAQQVQACTRIIEPHLPTLATLKGVGGRDQDDPTIEVVFWNQAGTLHGVKNTTGTQLIKALDHLCSLAFFTLGQTRARDRRPLPCNRCHSYSVGRWAGSDWYDCQDCGSQFAEDDLRRQDEILLELHRRGLIAAPE